MIYSTLEYHFIILKSNKEVYPSVMAPRKKPKASAQSMIKPITPQVGDKKHLTVECSPEEKLKGIIDNYIAQGWYIHESRVVRDGEYVFELVYKVEPPKPKRKRSKGVHDKTS